MQAVDLRVGTTVHYNGELQVVVEFKHSTPGNKRAIIQASFKSLRTGKIIQNRFSSSDNIDRAILDPKVCQYLYQDDQGFHFMDMESYNSFVISEAAIGNGKYYLKENDEIKIQFFEGSPVLPEYPKTVILKITESPPWVKGDSVSNNMKPAVCQTGLKVQVPIFVQEGDEIKVNTETGEYLGRI